MGRVSKECSDAIAFAPAYHPVAVVLDLVRPLPAAWHFAGKIEKSVRLAYLRWCVRESEDDWAANRHPHRNSGVPEFLSGILKGFLRKCGRQYDRASVIYKPFKLDASLLGLCDGGVKSLGPFHADSVGEFLSLITGGVGSGRIGFWTSVIVSSRQERETVFES
jgi:hypothetical protein